MDLTEEMPRPVTGPEASLKPHRFVTSSRSLLLTLMFLLMLGVAVIALAGAGDANSMLSAVRATAQRALGYFNWVYTQARSGFVHAPALQLGVLMILAMVPLAFLAGWSRTTDERRAGSKALPDTQNVGRTAALTGFSRPRRARLEGEVLGPSGLFEIESGLVRIGRAPDNEIVLDTKGLADYHAAIERTSEYDLYLCDLTRGSRRTVRVNGRSVFRRRLYDGDEIRLGNVQLVYRTLAL